MATVGYASGGLGAGLTDHTMLYDYRRHETIVMGGVGPFGIQREANGRIFEVVGPKGDYLSGGSFTVEGSIVYDGFHDIYFHFGGVQYLFGDLAPNHASPGLERIWYPTDPSFPNGYTPAFVSVSFSKGSPAVGPAPRTQCTMVYDEKRRVTVLFGGIGGARYSDTWELVTANNHESWVDFSYSGFEVGNFDYPFKTLAKGIQRAYEGARLRTKSGRTSETFSKIDKPMTLEVYGPPGSSVVIGQLP